MDLNELKKNIDEQTRNGREEIYMSTDDLRDLGLDLTPNSKMIFVNIYRLKQLIEKYEYEMKLEEKAKNKAREKYDFER